jgi:hypothetical protein
MAGMVGGGQYPCPRPSVIRVRSRMVGYGESSSGVDGPCTVSAGGKDLMRFSYRVLVDASEAPRTSVWEVCRSDF